MMMCSFSMRCRFVLLAALLAAACTEESVPGAGELTAAVELRVDNPCAISLKSTDAGMDSDIRTLKFAVYDPSGYLCGSGIAENGVLTLTLPTGKPGYKVAAYVNSPVPADSCSTFASVCALKSNLLSGAAGPGACLEMYGTLDNVTLSASEPCVVPVRRVAAKVQIDTIENRIASAPPFAIKGIYLINVNASSGIDASVTSGQWYQKRGYTASESSVTKFTADIFSADLAYGQSLTTSHYLYCYGNPVTVDSSSPTWCDRFTRLVVEADYAGRRYYYPVNIVGQDGTLNGGSLYRITRMTITGPGSDDPDVPISRSGAEFSITVCDWEQGFSQAVSY